MSFAERLRKVQDVIRAECHAVGRDPAEVTLVAASKTQPVTSLRKALEAGHRVFGENRVQEAQEKWPALKREYPDIQLHLIGPLQTNKVRDAVALFDVIETVDRPKLAKALAAEMVRTGRRPPCFIEVNMGEEPQKAGVFRSQADSFIHDCQNLYPLPLQGLMVIPPLGENPEAYFMELAQLAHRAKIPYLSMGMSADYPEAIRCGATHIRLGTALFGERDEQE